MKTLITIAFLAIAYFAAAGSTLQLTISACKTDSLDSYYIIKMYKDGIFIQNVLLSERNKYDTTLTNLNKGIYSFEFTNIFKKVLLDSIQISKDTLYWKPLCSDDFMSSKDSFNGYIDSLNNTEPFYIDFESVGCYHNEIQTLRVYKKENEYFSTLYPLKNRMESKFVKPKVKTVKLTESKIENLKAFQFDVYQNTVGYPFSTEITYYTFRFKKAQIRFTDSKENRGRFSKLLESLYDGNN